MNDPKILHQRFVEMGRQRNRLTNEMLAILPEIFKSEIYKKYAATIVEYAGKFGGIPASVVRKRLQLENNLNNKPCLKAAIRDVGVHKVYAVATIATPETDAVLADKVRNMSKQAIVTMAKELREKRLGAATMESICNAAIETIQLELDGDTMFLFLRLKQKLGKNLSNKEFMKTMIKRLTDEEFPQSRPGTSLAKNKKDGQIEIVEAHTDGRHVRVAKKRQELCKTNGRCAYPGCNRPPANWHHRDRFSASHSHESVVPLCKVHHEFMHNGLVKNELSEPQNWQMDLKNTVTNPIDILYRKYRLSGTV